MKIALFTAALLAATAFTPAAAITVINFDDHTGAGLLPVNYAGVNWDDNFSYYGGLQDPYNASSTPNRIFTNYDKHGFGAVSLAFYIGAGSIFSGASFAGSDSVTIESYLSGTLVGTSATFVTSSTPTFLSSGYSGSVDEIRFVGGVFHIADDVTFERLVAFEAVPEPESWALMIAGFGLVGAAMRRRHKVAAIA